LLHNQCILLTALGDAERLKRAESKLTEVIRLFEEILESKPASESVLCDCANAYWGLGKVEEMRGIEPTGSYRKAIRYCTRALLTNDSYQRAYLLRGQVYSSLALIVQVTGGDAGHFYRLAVMDFTEGLRSGPENMDLFGGRGDAYRRLGDFEARTGRDPRANLRKAVVDLSEAVRLNPNNAHNYNDRGVALMSLGDARNAFGEDPRETYREAVSDFLEALKRDPGITLANNNLGATYSRIAEGEAQSGGDPNPLFEKAAAAFREAIRYDPSWWESWANLGMALENLGRIREAVRSYEKAMSLTEHPPRHLKEWLRRARARPSRSIDWNRVRFDLERAVSAYERGDFVAAKVLLEKVLGSKAGHVRKVPSELKPILTGAHIRLARILSLAAMGKGQPEDPPKPISSEEMGRLQGRAISHVKEALALGGVKPEQLRVDPGLLPLQTLPEFRALLEEWKSSEERDR
ncbi:MAG: tetratricopeptide repeat protein, partial [Planctomycetota bacterium]